MDRTCALCGRVFKYPSGLKKHSTQRITPCVLTCAGALAVKSYSCICKHAFTTPQALSRHQKTCSAVKTEAAEKVLPESELTRRLLSIEQKMDMLAARNAAPTINIQNNFINGVTLNFFGREETSHITIEQVAALFDRAMLERSPDTLFKHAAMLIYSDPEHPENLTAYIPGASSDEAMIYQKDVKGGAKWCSVPLSEATPPMVSRTMDLLATKQPFADGRSPLEKYGELLGQVYGLESSYTSGSRAQQLHAILIRNYKLLNSAQKET